MWEALRCIMDGTKRKMNDELVEFETKAQDIEKAEEEKKKEINVRLQAEKQKLKKVEIYNEYVETEMGTHKKKTGHLPNLKKNIKAQDGIIKKAQKNGEVQGAKEEIINLIKEYINPYVKDGMFRARPNPNEGEEPNNFLQPEIKKLEIKDKEGEEDFETYYEKVKATKLDKIVEVLKKEKEWASGEIEKLNGGIKKIEEEEKNREKHWKEGLDKQAKEKEEMNKKIKDLENEISGIEAKRRGFGRFSVETQAAKKGLVDDANEKVEQIKQEEMEWEGKQKEASEIIKEGETGFEEKIKSIENRSIDKIKKEIASTKKELKELKKPRGASIVDKKAYDLKYKNLKATLKTLNTEYDNLYKEQGMKKVSDRFVHTKAQKIAFDEDVKIKEEKIEKKRKIKKNWAKAGLAASKILHTNFKLPMITDHITDDMVEDPDTLTEEQKEKLMSETENYRLLHNTPYISSDGDDVYARADKPTKPNFGKPFYNYYLKKTIKTVDSSRMYLYKDVGELKIFQMIEQRKARYIKWLMRKKSGTADIEELTKRLKKFEKESSGDDDEKIQMRNTLQEKIITLTFLEYLISRTDEVYISPLSENPTEEQKEELKASKIKRTMIDLHKTTIDGKTLFELFCIYVPGYSNKIDLNEAKIAGFNSTNFTKNTDIGDEDIIDSGLKRFNDYKSNHSDCGELEENEDNGNYLNIGLSNFSNIDNLKEWVMAKEEEDDKTRKKTKELFDKAQISINNAKEVKDNKLKALSEKIKKIIEDLKIDDADAKMRKNEQELEAMRAEVKQKKIEMEQGHAKKLKEQQQKYGEQAKIAERNLAVKEELIKKHNADMLKNQEKIETLEADLERQKEGIKTCKEGDAELKAQYETKKAELEAEINLIKQEKTDMEVKMNDLEVEKNNALKTQEELTTRITETEKKSEMLRKDIEARKSSTEVTKEKLIDGAEDDEDNPVDAAFNAMDNSEDGINIELDEEPLMVFLTQKDGELEVVTSKLPGKNISSWLMGPK